MRILQRIHDQALDFWHKVAPTVGIFASVGILVGAWSASGVTSLLIVEGLDVVSPRFFLVGAALVTAVVAFATGTSWGTVSTIGIALMGVAGGLGLNPAAAAGAVVVGAHFGDKLSPLSETATLASTVAGTNLYNHIRHTIYTTVPAYVVSLVVYLFLGIRATGPTEMGMAEELQRVLSDSFVLSPLLWLPVGLVLAAAIFRWPVIPSLLASAIAATALAVALQGFPVSRVPELVLFGYRPGTDNPAIDKLLAQGGIWAMGRLALAALGLFAVVIVAVRSSPGQRLLGWLARAARTPARAVLLAVVVTLGLIFASGSSYLSILVTGELMRDIFRRLGLAAENLSRTLEDSGTVVAPLVPWGVSGLFMTRTLGVSTWDYGLFATMNYLGFVFAALYGYTGWFIRPSDERPAR